MFAITIAFAAAWLTISLAGGTPIAELLQRIMVDTPARRLNRITRGHILTAAALLVFGGLLIWQLEGDGVRLLSMMAPEIGTWLAMFEISTWLDAVVAVVALSSTVRLRGWRAWIVAVLTRRTPGKHVRAHRSRKARRPADNDDDGAGGRRSPPARFAA